MRSLYSAAVAVAFLLSAGPAAQAQVNQETADEIRRGLKVWIGQFAQGLGQDVSIELDDQISVDPDGDIYRVVLPSGRAMVHGEGTLHFQPITMDLTPLDNGWYDARWQFPDSTRFAPDYGGSDLLFTIGSQSGQGVYAPELQSMMSMDMALGDMHLTDTDNTGGVRIASLTGTTRSTEVSPDAYDMDQRLALSGLSAYEDGTEFLSVGGIALGGTVNAIRLAEYAELSERFQQLAIDPEVQMDAIAGLMGDMPMPYSGFDGSMTVTDVEAFDRDERFAADSLSFGMELSGIGEETTSFSIDLGSTGMATSVVDLADLVPSDTAFRMALVGLPNSELARIFAETMASAQQVDPAMAALMATGDIQQALTTAGTAMEIGPIRLESNIASIDLQGELRPDFASPYSVVGEIDMTATGLDALIAEVQRTNGDPDVVQMLTLMQTLGAQAPEANGRTVRTYAFRLDSAGTLLLNGSDIMPLIGGMQ